MTRSVALSRFPWLSANIEYTVTREPYFSTPYTIKMYSDLKIAIVGLTSDGLMKNEYAEMEEDVCIERLWFQLNVGLDTYMKLKNQTSFCYLSWWVK